MRVTPPKRVTSPTGVPHLRVNRPCFECHLAPILALMGYFGAKSACISRHIDRSNI